VTTAVRLLKVKLMEEDNRWTRLTKLKDSGGFAPVGKAQSRP
jgi:hypothetical protein